jgi:hypothetical protein
MHAFGGVTNGDDRAAGGSSQCVDRKLACQRHKIERLMLDRQSVRRITSGDDDSQSRVHDI